jgi:hypothetical protein
MGKKTTLRSAKKNRPTPKKKKKKATYTLEGKKVKYPKIYKKKMAERKK